MPSNFQGTWNYASQTAKGSAVVKNTGTLTIEDNSSNEPVIVKVAASADKPGDPPSLELGVENPKMSNEISLNNSNMTHRGRLVILSTGAPAILIGTISTISRDQASDKKPTGPVGDSDVDVFIAVKTS